MNIVIGDLTEAKEQVIVHGCNAQGQMNSGVAKAIRTKWPKVFEVYRRQWDADIKRGARSMTMGSIIPVEVGNEKWVINAITQQYYGYDNKRYVSYDAVDAALEYVARLCDIRGVTNIALPKIGAGLGGGEWSVLESIIHHRLEGFNVNVYVLPESVPPVQTLPTGDQA